MITVALTVNELVSRRLRIEMLLQSHRGEHSSHFFRSNRSSLWAACHTRWTGRDFSLLDHPIAEVMSTVVIIGCLAGARTITHYRQTYNQTTEATEIGETF